MIDIAYISEHIRVVDLETAKRLKNLGYDKPSHWYWLDKDLPYANKGLKRVDAGKRRINHNKYDDFIYSAPTEKEIEKFIAYQNDINIKNKLFMRSIRMKEIGL